MGIEQLIPTTPGVILIYGIIAIIICWILIKCGILEFNKTTSQKSEKLKQ